jgi:hypothetical protein
MDCHLTLAEERRVSFDPGSQGGYIFLGKDDRVIKTKPKAFQSSQKK